MGTSYDDMIRDQESWLTDEDRLFWDGEVSASPSLQNDLQFSSSNLGNSFSLNQSPSSDFSLSMAPSLLSSAQPKDVSNTDIFALEKSTSGNKPTWTENLASGVNKMLGDPDQLGKIFGGAVSSAAAGVMAWLKQRQAERSAEKQLRMQKQVIDEKVARASAVPTIKRMTKDTPGKRPVNTYAKAAGGY